MLTRRAFLQNTIGTGVAVLSTGNNGFAVQNDLVITGGRVIDPANNLDGVLDVLIRDDRIRAVGANLDISNATKVLNAKGKLVVPGLIDIHTHTRFMEMPSLCLSDGVTSLIDGGSQGADRIDEILAVARAAPNLVRVLLNVAKTGITRPIGELMDLRNADVAAAQQAIERNQNLIVGLKARLSDTVAADADLEVVRRAQAIVSPFNLPIMVHVGNTASPLPEILKLLKPGDIVTHVYTQQRHGIFTNDGHVLPEVLAARDRGIWFDVGHGRIGHITWETGARAIDQGFLPDTISSDWSVAGSTDQVFNFPNVLSKFLLLGMSLSDVIKCGTINAAQVFPAFHDRGTLSVGRPADVAILDLRDGSFEFVDNEYTQRTGNKKLVATDTILNGRHIPSVPA
jgi:dihydroorotase